MHGLLCVWCCLQILQYLNENRIQLINRFVWVAHFLVIQFFYRNKEKQSLSTKQTQYRYIACACAKATYRWTECAQDTLISIIRMQNLQPQKINVPWYRINPILLRSNLLYLGLRSRLTTLVQNSCKARYMQKVNEKSQVSPKHRQTITIHSMEKVSLLRKTTTSQKRTFSNKVCLILYKLEVAYRAGQRYQLCVQ